ncbi:hypothetical protein HHI36_001670 [Cryptolaemus montrouzieri]|uniref:Cytosol aminopeptidase domain-containing protein n=1 Tax=Cryptolaemus montrouzieri TaxID=559131 RepID=A0ABD2P8B0_9CUCU
MVSLVFQTGLSPTDPQKNPVLIIGQIKHLTKIKYEHVKCKLQPVVSEDIFNAAVAKLHPSPTDSCSMYLNLATVAALPLKCSRHNTPSRAHSVTRLVQNYSVGVELGLDETIVIICEKQDFYASACAVARAFPLFNKKTSISDNPVVIKVEFIIVSHNSGGSDSLHVEYIDKNSIKAIEDAAEGIRLAQRIVDTPCSEMNVNHFLKEIEAVAQVLNLKTLVIQGEELAEKGFGGIYGVGKAASVPPALAVLSYTRPDATKNIAWVGKGIVYDTGGLSIKGKTDMVGMKRDCGGAAGILGAFYAAVKANFTQNLHAVFCLAENAVGPKATKPDDIHTLYSGKTVEINNTDAEGRLVLADGVIYAQRDLKADIILDMATLTGAQGIATGKYHAAVLTNNENWELFIREAGLISGDLIFPVPFCPELHYSEYTSAVADMKNSVKDRTNAQVSCAGLFMLANLGFDFPGTWIHVDMASPVHSGERATGYGVALLTTLFGKYCQQPLLNYIAPEIDSKELNAAKKPRSH